MTEVICYRQSAPREDVDWVVPASNSVAGALQMYQEGGHYKDGVHHLYAHALCAGHLAPKAAINMVVTPSHEIRTINIRGDTATREELHVDVTLILCHLYAFCPRKSCGTTAS